MENPLYKYLKDKIDYNNYYTIKKTIIFLDNQYIKAKKDSDSSYAKVIIDAANKVFTEFGDFYRFANDGSNQMSYLQKIWFKKLQNFIDYLKFCNTNDFK